MQKARELVRPTLSEDVSSAAVREKSEFLIEQDRFLCGNGGEAEEQVGHRTSLCATELTYQQRNLADRWQSQWIVHLLERVFWQRGGAARHPGTRQYFEPLRGETIYYVVTCLCWSIMEYATGIRKNRVTDKSFEGKLLSTQRVDTHACQNCMYGFESCGANSRN